MSLQKACLETRKQLIVMGRQEATRALDTAKDMANKTSSKYQGVIFGFLICIFP
jgi:hypothetical protein